MANDNDRKQRLAAQLRENLRRRKAQARARDAADREAPDANAPAKEDGKNEGA